MFSVQTSEPINFAQREPKLPGLTEGVLDAEWERLEVEDPTCDDEDNISDTNPDDNENIEKVEEGDDGMKKSEEEKTDPSVAYANEPPVYHYCSLESIAAVRERLSTRWEPGLCSQLDSLISQMEARQTKSKPVKIESKERKFINCGMLICISIQIVGYIMLSPSKQNLKK